MVVGVLTSQQSWAAGKGPLPIKPPKTFPFVITQPGSYQLIGNLTVAAATNAIIIQADNVVLDLNGFTVQGNGGAAAGIAGIVATSTSARSITVKNGSVRAFPGNGINLAGRGHLVTDVKAEGNASDGIFVSQASVVEHCTATGNGGNGIETSKACAIKDNVCSTNTVSGIRAGQSCTILQNTSASNGAHGINADQGSTMVQNTCSENTASGIEMGGRCLAQQNNCFFNDIGIDDGGSGSQIKDNVCTLNTLAGIAVVSDNEISHNSCNRLNGMGIFCGGSNNSVVDNTCLQNTGAGIDLGNGGGNYAATNKLSANGSAIAHAAGNTLGSGDLANVLF
jgi:parallel beta-helix repeat protein